MPIAGVVPSATTTLLQSNAGTIRVPTASITFQP
jgi:hypothetical protein